MIFDKTPKGRQILVDPQSPLPQRTRILLRCINGRATADTLVVSLTALGDVKGMLRGLLLDGLIERADKMRRAAAPIDNRGQAQSQAQF
jgi:hypothetical protein